MTSIDFYTRVEDPIGIAARLVGKAFAQHGHVRVLTPDAEATAALDRLLWTQPAVGFLPHCTLSAPLARETPIIVDHAIEHGAAAILRTVRAACGDRRVRRSLGARRSRALSLLP